MAVQLEVGDDLRSPDAVDHVLDVAAGGVLIDKGIAGPVGDDVVAGDHEVVLLDRQQRLPGLIGAVAGVQQPAHHLQLVQPDRPTGSEVRFQ